MNYGLLGLALFVVPAVALLLALLSGGWRLIAYGYRLHTAAELPTEPVAVPAAVAVGALGRGLGIQGEAAYVGLPRSTGKSQGAPPLAVGRITDGPHLIAVSARRLDAAEALLDDLHWALERPLRTLLAGATPRDPGNAGVPGRLALRSDARQPRLVEAVLFDPGQADLGLAWEDQVAVLPLWEERVQPAVPLRDADDALVPRFVPKLPPKPISLAEAYPNCPGNRYSNPYPRGVCTWYAKDRRPDLVGFWGEYGLAINWPYAAAACGYRVDGIPAAGAVIVFPPGANGAYWGGHVGYVEAVEEDALLISECNVTPDSAGIVDPIWWEAGYSCAFRRIPWTRLSPQVEYIHGWREPVPLSP